MLLDVTCKVEGLCDVHTPKNKLVFWPGPDVFRKNREKKGAKKLILMLLLKGC